MTRKPAPKSPCPTCGRLVGSYHASTGPIRTVRHMKLGPNAIRAHKATGAPWCPGGVVKNKGGQEVDTGGSGE